LNKNVGAIAENTAMCGSRKYPYSPHGRLLEIPRGRGVLKVKPLEAEGCDYD